MAGQALEQATAAARAFVAAKPPADRVSVLAFGSTAFSLTGFSTSTTDADSALRTITPDAVRGTALYDAVVNGSHLLGGETMPARVLILLTDGANESPTGATLDDAIQAAQDAGVAVYAGEAGSYAAVSARRALPRWRAPIPPMMTSHPGGNGPGCFRSGPFSRR